MTRIPPKLMFILINFVILPFATGQGQMEWKDVTKETIYLASSFGAYAALPFQIIEVESYVININFEKKNL